MEPFTIALIGDHNPAYVPHVRAVGWLTHLQQTFSFSFDWISTELLREDTAVLESYAGIWAGSGPYKSKAGVINGIRFARQNNIPFLGTCSGFGYAVLEFAQFLLELDVVYHPDEGMAVDEHRHILDKLPACGLDMYEVRFSLRENTQAHRIYNTTDMIREVSHCSYGLHPSQISAFAERGMIVSASDETGKPTILEYAPNDLFLLMLFYPQLRSIEELPHPILAEFLAQSGRHKITPKTHFHPEHNLLTE